MRWLLFLALLACDQDRLRSIGETPAPAATGGADPCAGPAPACALGACGGPAEATCADSVWACLDPTPPAPETCNHLDDDCDGQTDEDLYSTCWPADACAPGISRCGDPNCYFFVAPVPETCDLMDNDCDGVVDEGFPLCCGAAPIPELCDGEDNNCDGLIDEGLRDACGNCPGDEPSEIPCDGYDNDCDGQTDEQDAAPIEIKIAVDESGSNEWLPGQKPQLQAGIRDLGALFRCALWDVVAFPTDWSGAGGVTYLAQNATAAEAEAAVAKLATNGGYLEPAWDIAAMLAVPRDPAAINSVVMVADEPGMSMTGLTEATCAAAVKGLGAEVLTFSNSPDTYDLLGPSRLLGADIRAEMVGFVKRRAGL